MVGCLWRDVYESGGEVGVVVRVVADGFCVRWVGEILLWGWGVQWCGGGLLVEGGFCVRYGVDIFLWGCAVQRCGDSLLADGFFWVRCGVIFLLGGGGVRCLGFICFWVAWVCGRWSLSCFLRRFAVWRWPIGL